MYVRVEPTGCCERKGLVQIRFCFYLEPSDARYDVHHIQVPVRPLTDEEVADPKLAELVPKKWQTNPFHNHFIYVEPDTSDEEIMDIGGAILNEAYIKWVLDESLDLKNSPVKFYTTPSRVRLEAVKVKVQHLKTTALERLI